MGKLFQALDAIKSIDGKLSLLLETRNTRNCEAWKHERRMGSGGDIPQSMTFDYPNVSNVGERFKAIRECLGITQARMAQELRISSCYISRIESGDSSPSSTLIYLFSLIYGVDEHWIATGKLPQASESPSKAMGNVNPLSGFDGKLSIKESMDSVRQARLEVQDELKAQEDSR